ncbi:MAG: site-2 protease family protein [Burkholderiaceae bacterium]
MQLIAVYAIPVIFAITLHEAAHGFVAYRLGDPTAKLLGRVTANPIKHIDPVGTILVPGLILLASKAVGGAMLFGWAKPVPVDTYKLGKPKRDMGLVAVAGPLANIIMAFAWAVSLKMMVLTGVGNEFFIRMTLAGISVNLVLAVLNLMPVPPLDGGRILVSVLPPNLAQPVARLEPYGLVILLLLLATGVLGDILLPLVNTAREIILTILGFER